MDPLKSVTFRYLTQEADSELALEIFKASQDYLDMETGQKATLENVKVFFEELPPKVSPDAKISLGITDGNGNGIGLMDVVRGYRRTTDWYIGQLMLTPEARGRGLGKEALEWVSNLARSEGARRLLLCVVEENVKGRAFWEREGFTLRKKTPPWTTGVKTHERYELVRSI